MQLGRIKLNHGRGQLTLRALQVPGKQVAGFWLLMLTRVG